MNIGERGERPAVLIVDDEAANLKVMRQVLQKEYRLHFATSGERALEIAAEYRPGIILLDVLMEGMDGYAVCRELKKNPKTAAIPVIFITVLGEQHNEEKGFAAGAVDYISKPVKPSLVRARIKTHLSLVRFDLLREAQQQIIERLSRAAEFKNIETSCHIVRMSRFARLLALADGQGEIWSENLFHAAPMHDVGKIGVPDDILNKPGQLNAEEWEIIQSHPMMGASIIGRHENSPVLEMAYNVALEHHERWDGTGYPGRLKGEEITLEARIAAIADVFDALTNQRPYKVAWSVEDAFDYIRKGAGTQFDPQLALRFAECREELLKIRRKCGEGSLCSSSGERVE